MSENISQNSESAVEATQGMFDKVKSFAMSKKGLYLLGAVMLLGAIYYYTQCRNKKSVKPKKKSRKESRSVTEETDISKPKYQLSEKIDSSKNILKPFNETSKAGTLNFSSGDNIVIADGQAKTLRGLDGNDTYFVSNLLPKDSTIEIIDTSGSNIIQIAANTKVIKTLWTKDAARLTFEDDRVITINGADKFTFNMGGNVTDGTEGTDLTFAEAALSFGIDDVLNLSGSNTGTVTDLYII